MRKVLIVLAVVLVAALLPSGAAANTVESSTIHFEGALTDAGGGVFTGTIDATAGLYYLPGGDGEGIWDQGGFDVYAREGATAYVQGLVPETVVVGDDHDAHSTPGPWGTWYDPDVADWNQYDLELTADHWYLRYASTGESPISGSLSWNGDGTGCAVENDLGTQDGGHDGSAAHGGGSQAWDWDCGWGVEVIPLEYWGFDVSVTSLGGGDYEVTLTPASCGSCPVMPWPTPVGDDDCDGFTTPDERAIYGVGPGSDEELTACRTDTVDDPWPPDTFGTGGLPDRLVDGQDLVMFLPHLFKGFGAGGYSARYDIYDPGVVIDGQDLTVMLPFMFQSCTPP